MFKHQLWLDLETRSRVNLKKHGVHRYVACPAHEILVAGWALDDNPVTAAFTTNAAHLFNILRDSSVQICAHNAAFERLNLNKALGIKLPIERFYCTATQARAVALPGKLEDLGRAVGANLRKDTRGLQLIQALCIPQPDGSFNEDPALLEELRAYCATDVAVMRGVSQAMQPLTDEALAVYHASEHINDRGLPIDVELCRLATHYAEAEKVEAEQAVVEISRGAIQRVKGTKLRDWVYSRLDASMKKHMELHRNGKRATSLSVDVRATLMELAESDPEAIDADTLAMIEAADAGAMSSVAKFQTMLDRVSDDGRLRGAFITNGAVQTGRWSSTGAQVHNFPRLTHADPESARQAMQRGEPIPRVLQTLKSLLRPAIRAVRYNVIRSDWSAIEARGLPWLAMSPNSNSRVRDMLDQGVRRYLAAFSEPGRDIYVEQSHASGLGGERQPGKVVVLSLGYGGAENALARMAKNYGVTIPEAGRVVARWRAANPWVADKRTGWWASLMRCAIQALKQGKPFTAGRVTLAARGSSLVQILPSGREIHYPMARIEEGDYGPEITYLKASWKPKADAKEWPRARLWHGVLAENATQAACADLLRAALVRGVAQGLPIIGHVHDEIICEGGSSLAPKLQRCMLTAPDWAEGFPLAAEVAVGKHFAK